LYPNLFTIPGINFVVTTFGVMMFFAFIGGAWIAGRQAMRYGLPSELIWDSLAYCAIAGIVGAKLYFIALNWNAIRQNPATAFHRGGLVWYGGLIGGVAAFGFYVTKRKLPVMTMYDAAAPGLALAYAIGRVGCFLVGDDYGRFTDSAIGVVFRNGGIPRATAGLLRSLGDSVPMSFGDDALVPVHPTQLYEVALALLILAILWHYGRKSLHTGQLFAMFLFLYSIERFFIEFVRLKGDRYMWGLSTSQFISIALFAFAIWLFAHRRNSPLAPR
jgi:phosphatidylglycerol:prolipoprotein diacylglycerol transferase